MKSGKVQHHFRLRLTAIFPNTTILANENEIAFNSSNNIYVLDRTTKAEKGHSNLHKLYSHSQIYFIHRCKNPDLWEAGESRITFKCGWTWAKRLNCEKLIENQLRNEDEKEFTFTIPRQKSCRASISPDGRMQTFSNTRTETNKPTKVPDYVARQANWRIWNSRSKVPRTKAYTKTWDWNHDLQRWYGLFLSVNRISGGKKIFRIMWKTIRIKLGRKKIVKWFLQVILFSRWKKCQ